MDNPAAPACVRALCMARIGKSLSKPAIETVFGRGVIPFAISKKPFAKSSSIFPPTGLTLAHRSYLNSAFVAEPSNVTKAAPCCMTTGIAGAIIAVP